MEVVFSTITKTNPFIAYLEYFNISDKPSEVDLESSISLMIRTHLKERYFCSPSCSICIGDFNQDVLFDEDGNAKVSVDFLLDEDNFNYEGIVYSLFENKPEIISEGIRFREWYLQNKYKELTYPSDVRGDQNDILNAKEILARAIATNPDVPIMHGNEDSSPNRWMGLVSSWLRKSLDRSNRRNKTNIHFTYKDVQPKVVSFQFVSQLLKLVANSQSCIRRIGETSSKVTLYQREQLDEKLKSHSGLYQRYDNPLVHPVCSRCSASGLCNTSVEYTQEKLDLMGQELTVARGKYKVQIASLLRRKLNEGNGEYIIC